MVVSGPVDVDVYRFTAKQLVTEGRVALMLADDGGRVVLEEGFESPIVTTDLWEVVKQAWPKKVGACPLRQWKMLNSILRNLMHQKIN